MKNKKVNEEMIRMKSNNGKEMNEKMLIKKKKK